ncbi:MAG TPA: prephenate dehydrogenase/arogenate dehydrogenase family protein [Candidatus Angelobacter sp.]|jgi:prephenate dehydrogenase|nr:prephenate dehydrogenase/arogenate dehydrogenase family protein [Candidatus Angelobacter sp.]
MRTITTGGVEAPQAVAVVGLGLIGASLCRALREKLPDMGIVGVTRSVETAERAMNDGICDLAGTTSDLLRHVDLAVLCTPVDAMPFWMEQCEFYPGLLVTDTGSTKQWVVEQAAKTVDRGRFLGGHPMAGRERSGYAAAETALFDGCTWVFTPTTTAQQEPFAPWVAAVEALGARVEVMDAADHDRTVAWISHLPFALSAALVRAAAAAPEWADAQRLAAGGFRDMARLAGGDPEMYAAITASNQPAILESLNALTRELDRLSKALRKPETAQAYFATAQQLRAAWLSERAEQGRPVR